VGGLNPKVEERDLTDFFSRVGRVVSVQIKLGFAFVELENDRVADRAVQECGGKEFQGQQISVQRAGSRGSKGKGEGKGKGGGASFGSQVRKPGDWECPDCGTNNFASRSACFKCHAPKPAIAEQNRFEHRDRNRSRSRDRDRARSQDRPDRGGRFDRAADRSRSRSPTRDDREASNYADQPQGDQSVVPDSAPKEQVHA